MAKIQLSMEELLQLIKGDLDTPELKKQLANSLLDVWTREDTRQEIEARGKEFAEKKMQRTIEDSFRVEKGRWGGNDKVVGWAVPLIREEVSKATLPMILEAIRPELEKAVGDLVQQEFGKFFMKFMANQANQSE